MKIVSLLTLCLLLGACASSQAPTQASAPSPAAPPQPATPDTPLRIGQWEGTRTLQLTDFPIPPRPQTLWTCLSADDALKKPELLSPMRGNPTTANCTVGTRQTEGKRLTAPLICKDIGRKGRLDIEIDREAVTSTVLLFKTDNEAEGIWAKISETHKWMGEACKLHFPT